MSASNPIVSPIRLAAVLAAINTLAAAHAGNPTYYVDDDAPPGGDGTSWNTAFRDLQDALDRVNQDHPLIPEIRVAQGTYTPDRGTLDRTQSFVLNSAVSLIGGFAGLGAANPDALDPARFVSVLSGDLRRDDTPDFGNRTDNSYHVVDVSRADGTAQLNGFTIRGGHADNTGPAESNRGAGIFGAANQGCTVTLNNCRLIDNYARDDGAAASLAFGGMTIFDSLVAGNHTSMFGTSAGITAGRTVWAQRVRFADNAAEHNAASGSALAAQSGCYIRDCLFDSNDPYAPVLSAAGIVSLHRSTFARNGGDPLGSVIIVTNTQAEIDGCIFDDPPAGPPHGEIFVTGLNSSLRITNSCVRGGESGVGQLGAEIIWGAGNIDADPHFTDPDGPDNDPATWQDNDFSLAPGSPCIDAGDIDIRDPADLDQRQQPRYISARGDCLRRADMGAIENQDASSAPPIPVLFVNAAASPGGDGLSWATAYRDLNDALRTPGVREIWIAAGSYTPDMGTGDPRLSFDIQCRARILGGFNGTEIFAEQRDPDANPTILTGDLLGNDDGSPESLADNTQHLLRMQLADAVLDGVTIERGHSTRGGAAALLAMNSDIALNRCTLDRNTSEGDWADSGAVYLSSCRLSIDRSRLSRNSATGISHATGGVMYAWASEIRMSRTIVADNTSIGGQYGANTGGIIAYESPLIDLVDCDFLRNSAYSSLDNAYAGAFSLQGAELNIVGCTFADNAAVSDAPDGWAGEGAGTLLADQLRIINSVFIGNRARGDLAGAGAFYFADQGSSLIADCTIVNNISDSTVPASEPGGIVHLNPGNAAIVNTILWGNTNSDGSGQSAQLSAPGAQLSHNCIQGWDNSLPGGGNFSADPLFRSASDFHLSPGSPCIDAGDAALLPADTLDLDHDGDTAEPLPVDASNLPRVFGPGLDIGAYETQPCAADYNADALVNSSDFFAFLNDYFTSNPRADFNADAVIDSNDFFAFLDAFFTDC